MKTQKSAYEQLGAAAKKVGKRYGYEGRPGGWIYKDGRPVQQGWWCMGKRWQVAGIISGDWQKGYTIDWEAAEARFSPTGSR